MMSSSGRPLVLASGSATRAGIMRGAGLTFTQIDSGVDEAPLKAQAAASGLSPEKTAETLAFAKAKSVSTDNPEALVVGADQILVCGSRCFDKPETLDEARRHLGALRGQIHSLETSVCVFQAGVCLWHFHTAPRLTMRNFSDAELTDYLTRVGEEALWSVGGYQIEGPAIQLFEKIDGDYFSILGLPIIPLLDFLRQIEGPSK